MLTDIKRTRCLEQSGVESEISNIIIDSGGSFEISGPSLWLVYKKVTHFFHSHAVRIRKNAVSYCQASFYKEV
jgi:hypothetical protein